MGMKLFEPITINGMTLKNRMGFPPFLNMPAETRSRTRRSFLLP